MDPNDSQANSVVSDREMSSVTRAHRAAEERIQLARVLAKQAGMLEGHGSIRNIASNLVGTPHIPQDAIAELELLEQEAAKLRATLMTPSSQNLDEQAAAACRIAVETSRLAARLALEQTDPAMRGSPDTALLTQAFTEEEPTVTYISETNVHSTLNLGMGDDRASSKWPSDGGRTGGGAQPSPIPTAGSPRLGSLASPATAEYLARLSQLNRTATGAYDAATTPVHQTSLHQSESSGTAYNTDYRPKAMQQRSRSTPTGPRGAPPPPTPAPSAYAPLSGLSGGSSTSSHGGGGGSGDYNGSRYDSVGRGVGRPIGPAGASWNFLSFKDDTTTPREPVQMTGPVFDDSRVLSTQHYHHGDHHHNHWQRHVHHFHDLHVIGTAEEVLDLRSDHIEVESKVIQGESLPQMKFRPDAVGRQAFEEGMDSFLASIRQKYGFPTPNPY